MCRKRRCLECTGGRISDNKFSSPGPALRPRWIICRMVQRSLRVNVRSFVLCLSFSVLCRREIFQQRSSRTSAVVVQLLLNTERGMNISLCRFLFRHVLHCELALIISIATRMFRIMCMTSPSADLMQVFPFAIALECFLVFLR